jgi:molecular chaperone HscB
MDPFATLGFARRYDLDKAELERRYRELQQALHPDKHTAAASSARSMTLRKAVEVNEAYRILRDDTARAEALLAAVGGAAHGANLQRPAADSALLTEMMELREALSDARETQASEQIAELAEQVRAREAQVRTALAAAFAGLPVTPEPAALTHVQGLVSRLRYYRRFLDEVAAYEDEALS